MAAEERDAGGRAPAGRWARAGAGVGRGGPGGDGATRAAKFRQAAFVYLHVGILYEMVVWVFWQQGLLPETRGPVWVWLLVGALILAAVFAALWFWQNRWVARAIWALHFLRVPALVGGGFFPEPDAAVPPSFYLVALFVVLINLAFLARAGWDL